MRKASLCLISSFSFFLVRKKSEIPEHKVIAHDWIRGIKSGELCSNETKIGSVMNNDRNNRTIPTKFSIARVFIINKKRSSEHLFDVLYRFTEGEDNKLVLFPKNVLTGWNSHLIPPDNSSDDGCSWLRFLECFSD